MVVSTSTQTLSSSRSSTGRQQELDSRRSSSSSNTREERRSCQGVGRMQVAVGSLFWGAAHQAGVAT